MQYVICGLFILLYGSVSVLSVYFALTGKLVTGKATIFGNILIWHGRALVVGSIVAMVIAWAIVLAKVIMASFGFQVVTPGMGALSLPQSMIGF